MEYEYADMQHERPQKGYLDNYTYIPGKSPKADLPRVRYIATTIALIITFFVLGVILGAALF